MIKTNNRKEELPTVFGQYDDKSFFSLFNAIENSNFDLKQIKNFYFFKSGRWDIETNSGMLIKLPRQNFQQNLDLSSMIKIMKIKIFTPQHKIILECKAEGYPIAIKAPLNRIV